LTFLKDEVKKQNNIAIASAKLVVQAKNAGVALKKELHKSANAIKNPQ